MSKCVRAGDDGKQCTRVQLPRQSTCVAHTSEAAIFSAFAALSRTCDGGCPAATRAQGKAKGGVKYPAREWEVYVSEGEYYIDVEFETEDGFSGFSTVITHCPWCGGKLDAPDA